ncbi:hypothetical protein ASG38_04585 [Flavobacterium sp. Leaf359]|uniref:hypothetical protein n=1 Tax=Flavobacterium sp. Leaf359 TaxID=1736351 RepID=UPI0006FD75CE|nr:hypothetical protein [Flavobacterium sp. Leaf359]KQS50253.1 hypothetical protein ASG38_04585 [Flavobacterium sp. Leaf359]
MMNKDIQNFVENNKIYCSNKKSVTQNGINFTILSKESFICFEIDGKIINTQNSIKCDWGFIRESNEDFYFVELKGKNGDHGFDQIITTIEYMNSHILKIPKNKTFGFLVANGYVPKESGDVQKKKIIFRDKYGKSLEVCTNKKMIHKPK